MPAVTHVQVSAPLPSPWLLALHRAAHGKANELGQGPGAVGVVAARAVSVPTIRATAFSSASVSAALMCFPGDVEVAEPSVLAGFDIDQDQAVARLYRGAPTGAAANLLDYFAVHGYVLLGRYLRADLQNLSPVGDPHTR